MRRWYLTSVVVVVGVLAGTLATTVPSIIRSFDAERQSAPPHAERPTAGAKTAPLPLAAVGGDSTAAMEAEYRAFVEGVQREQDRLAAEAAAQAERDAAAAAAARRAGGGGGGGGTCGDGWVIPGEYVWRESKCDFNAQSPSSFCGGHGCVGAYQFDSRHWDAGSGWGGCADLGDWRDPEAQHECARRLSRDGTNLAPWGG